jgi:hypothetical protein
MDSDLAVFVIPVYSEYPCSNYFIFRERSQSYFDDVKYERYLTLRKKFIIIANSGYLNAVNVIRNDFNDIDEKSILNLSSNTYRTKSVLGNLIEFEGVRTQIKEFLIGDGKNM